MSTRPTAASWTLLVVALAASACSSDNLVAGVDGGGSVDVPIITNDLGATIDAPVDVSTIDAPAVDVPFRCASEADCSGNTTGSVCDVATGRCVACTAARDVCPTGQRCDDASHACVAGCRDDSSCATTTGADSSVGARRRCDLNSRACVDCLVNDDCPAGTLCVGNLCVAGCAGGSRCPTGQSCCAGACVDTLANVAHCGRCDARCSVPNGGASCLNGACSVATCAAPYGDCDRDAANGCETNTLTAVAHCGACGAACPTRANASATCAGATCGYTCNAGFADCDGDATNGCEVDTRTDTAHCGTCTTMCSLPRATAACVAGGCQVTACTAGYADCDGAASNGCESDTRVDVSHCGGCGRACAVRPNAAPACVGSACVTTCIAGYSDCNTVEADGCERNLRNDPANCGACGRACGAGGACCEATCATTASDPANCGACGHACAANEACESGRCQAALGCASGPRRGFTDVAAFPRIAACGARVSFAAATTTAATVCAPGWHFCNPADLNATTGTAPDFVPADAMGWVLYTDPTTTVWGDYSVAACGGVTPAVANLAGTGACTASGVYPEGWRLATSTSYWPWSHRSSSGCVEHAVHMCITDGGTIPATTAYVLCCAP